MKRRTKVLHYTLICAILLIGGLSVVLYWKQDHEREMRRNDVGNLKTISASLLVYAADNEGLFPDQFSVLVNEDLLPAGRVYVSPYFDSSGSKFPKTATDVQRQSWGYVYLGKGVSTNDPNPEKRVVMHTQLFEPGQWVSFLFVDGHVEGEECVDINSTVAKKGWILSAAEQETAVRP